MMGLFSTVEIDTANKEHIVHVVVCVENSDSKDDRTVNWNNKPDDQSNSLH